MSDDNNDDLQGRLVIAVVLIFAAILSVTIYCELKFSELKDAQRRIAILEQQCK